MAAFKDKKNGSWYVQFRYTDWRGERQQKLKRGFATKKEAQAWEREFLMQKQADINMSFESFVALYEKDVKPKLKLNTWLSKEHIIRTKILPYFKKRKLSEITARDVIDWQNEIGNQVSYRYPDGPCRKDSGIKPNLYIPAYKGGNNQYGHHKHGYTVPKTWFGFHSVHPFCSEISCKTKKEELSMFSSFEKHDTVPL